LIVVVWLLDGVGCGGCVCFWCGVGLGGVGWVGVG